jgi:two-component system, chemotaxis family, sensor kinase CheA
MLSAEDAALRTDRDIVNLIFQPGFSTAAVVTNISGRGVGMDVVRTNIESIGGSVDVQSTIGTGTTFRVKIPLTLAIIPALIVTCKGDRYAIPQVSLVELLRVEQDAIEEIDGQRVYRLRGRLLPLVHLDSVFGREDGTGRRSAANIVVVQADERAFGLVVDEINDTNEIVVKPLGRFLQHIGAFAGATIMGDGRVALILDILGFAEHVGLSRTLSEVERSLFAGADIMTIASGGDEQRLLIVRVGDRRFSLPLDTVARLEEFPADTIETANNRPAVQYGSEIMPLVRLADELGVGCDLDTESLQAIVFSAGPRNVGLLVDEILDIVEEVIEADEDGSSHGLLGASIIHGRVTDLVDIHAVLSSALPHIFRQGVAA